MSPLSFRSLEVKTQPDQLRLGDLLRKRRLIAGALPGPKAPGGPLLIFEEDAWCAMGAASRTDISREQIGVLYGRAATDGARPWLHVTHSFHARSARGTSVHVDLDPAAWEDIHNQARNAGLDDADAENLGIKVVGWWHTHPNLGAFFSGTDRDTQSRAFPRTWQVGIVIDPVRRECAIFRGGDSKEILLRPIIVGRTSLAPPLVPSYALRLALPADAHSLPNAAWECLQQARLGAVFQPLPHPAPHSSLALVFDRPLLKKRYPHISSQLRSDASVDGNWHAACPLKPSDVACVLAYGHFRSCDEIFGRSQT